MDAQPKAFVSRLFRFDCFAFLSELFPSCPPRHPNHDHLPVPYIPPEILSDILCRSPVKPLIQFRCVSKSWRGLIDSQEFRKMHLNRSVATRTNLNIILRDNFLHSIPLDGVSTRRATARAVKLDQPFNPGASQFEIMGSCNGLLCLGFHEGKQHITFVICNPSVRKYRKLPRVGFDFRLPRGKELGQVKSFCGFGYDAAGDEYKIVTMYEFYNTERRSIGIDAKVYRTKSTAWNQIPGCFPYSLCRMTDCGMIVNGAAHWAVSNKQESSEKSTLIAAFDYGTETARLIPHPEYDNQQLYAADVELLGEYLALICKYYSQRFDVWVMKEYGVKDSWTKLVSLSFIPSGFSDIKLLAYSKNSENDIFFLKFRDFTLEKDPGSFWFNYYVLNYRLVWYSTEKKTVNNVRIRNVPKFQEACMCVESLTQLPDIRE